jgi:hypothetical protein
MRTLCRVTVDTQLGNRGIQDGSFQRLIGQTIERWKPESTYFMATDGRRSGLFVVDFKDSSQIPPFCEPWFVEFGAQVELTPVMNRDELGAALSSLGKK